MKVGVIGGGQLARMMIPAAVELGIDIRVLAEVEGSSAALAATSVGDYRDVATVLAFTEGLDVVTFDHEHVPSDVLAAVRATGVSVQPSPEALLYAQDKLAMREALGSLGIPIPDWARVVDAAGLDAFIAEQGGRVVVKTPRGGYDGKGVRVVSSAADVADWFAALEPGAALLAEQLVQFRRELAQLVARTPSGRLEAWPLVETVQLGGVCNEVIAPAPGSMGRTGEVASTIAVAIAEGLGVTGVLAVEMFETVDDRLLVNELAMRPHNSGHWTIDGSTTSQFEQHLRAVLDLPLGATGSRAPWSVMANVLGGPSQGSMADRYPALLGEHPTVKVHNYGKEPRPGRKVGHVTVIGDDLDELVYQARAAAAILTD